MTLRVKTLLIVGSSLIALVGSLFVISDILLISSYARLEETSVQRNVSRVQDAINDELRGIEGFTGDYSDWDETVNFVLHPNKDYINSNLQYVTFDNLKINAFIFLNGAGKLIWGEAYTLGSDQFHPLPVEISEHLKTNDALLQHKDHEDTKAGLLLQDDWPAMIVSRPLMNSRGEGQIFGTVIIGRNLDDSRIEKISKQTHLKFSLQRVDRQLSSDFIQARERLTSDRPIFVKPKDKKTVSGYTLLNDIEGKPAVMLQVDVARDVFRQGQLTIRYFLFALLGVGIVFVLIITLMLERLVLARLSRLSRDVKKVGDTSDFSARVYTAGKDELSDLGTTINWMLSALADSQTALEQEKQSVDLKVQTRTAELKQAKDRIEELYEHDREVEALKSQFVSIASHELRTPVAEIQVYTDGIAQSAKKPKEFAQYLSGLRNGTSRLVDLLENLINISSIEKGQIVPHLESTDLVVLIQKIVAGYQVAAQTKKLKLDYSVTADKLETVKVDPQLMRRAISNIVNNAIKFTDKGNVQVILEQAADAVNITVNDTGPGIPKEQMHLLFQKFSKGSVLVFKEGRGLGLYLTKLIVEGHGGSVVAKSSKNGSSFTVHLPHQP